MLERQWLARGAAAMIVTLTRTPIWPRKLARKGGDFTLPVPAKSGLNISVFYPTFALSKDDPRYPWTVFRRSRMAFFTL